MVDLTIFQEVFYTAGALSVIVASVYYTITLRGNKRNYEHTLETRQAQLLMGLFQAFWDKDNSRSLTNVFSQTWDTPDEFWGRLRVDTNLYADYSHMLRYFDSIGYLVKSGFLDSKQVYDILDGGRPFILMWGKYGDLIKSRRITEGTSYAANLEYIYGEMIKLRSLNGETIEAHHSGEKIK